MASILNLIKANLILRIMSDQINCLVLTCVFRSKRLNQGIHNTNFIILDGEMHIILRQLFNKIIKFQLIIN